MFGITFLHPGRLWILIVPAVILFGYIVLTMRPGMGRSGLNRLSRLVPRESAVKRHVSVAAALLSLCSLILAYAQPLRPTLVPRDRATIVVAIDVSKSMQAKDVSPDRLTAAKQGAVEFIGTLPPRFNVSLVTFSGVAQIVVPPTTDRSMLERAINSLQLAPSTAIGEGILQSLEALKLAPPDPEHPDTPAPGAIVLLSDGATNTGTASAYAAQQAKDARVPVYTIAYGTPGGYVVEGNGQRIPVPVNHGELAKIAQISGGKKYAADSLQSLQQVYKTIASVLGQQAGTVEITDRFVFGSLILAVLAALGVMSLAARWP